MLAIMGWYYWTFPSIQIINKPFTAIFFNAIISNQPEISNIKYRNQISLLVLVSLWLHISLIITLIVWWYISIFILNKLPLCIGIRLTIISLGLTCDLWILWLKLLIINYKSHWAISSTYSINKVLFIVRKTNIIVAFFIPDSMKAYYIVHY